MTREELEAQAKALDVSFNSRTKDETLQERIAAAQGEAVEPVEGGMTSNDAPAMVRVLCKNLWTSQGKYFAGDDVALPREEAERLEAEDKVVIK